MSRKGYETRIIIEAVEEYLEGKTSVYEIARRLGVSKRSIARWVANYVAMGGDTFENKRNNHYSRELKEHGQVHVLSVG